VLERRRRLRPLVPGLQPASERVATLAAEAGLARPPALVLGAATQRDGFSYGTPGRYRIALPRAVAVRWASATLFDPLVRHELAHVAHRDVALAWLARSVWYALAPLLAAPLVVMLLSSDRSLLPDYVWRAAVLAVVVQLVSSALLRSREHDADLRAARAIGGPQAVAAVVARARDPGKVPWHRRLLANHPSPARRLAVLERPELAAEVTFLDGFTAAFWRRPNAYLDEAIRANMSTFALLDGRLVADGVARLARDLTDRSWHSRYASLLTLRRWLPLCASAHRAAYWRRQRPQRLTRAASPSARAGRGRSRRSGEASARALVGR